MSSREKGMLYRGTKQDYQLLALIVPKFNAVGIFKYNKP
jgi:hypothetical protein